jgi:hypothetical protein
MAESMSEKQLRDFAKTTWNFDDSSEQEEWQIAARWRCRFRQRSPSSLRNR